MMNFKDKENISLEKIEIFIPNRSILIMTNDARYKYSHGISYRKTDNMNGKINLRGKRISITLRKVLLEKCECKWYNLCDSQIIE